MKVFEKWKIWCLQGRGWFWVLENDVCELMATPKDCKLSNCIMKMSWKVYEKWWFCLSRKMFFFWCCVLLVCLKTIFLFAHELASRWSLLLKSHQVSRQLLQKNYLLHNSFPQFWCMISFLLFLAKYHIVKHYHFLTLNFHQYQLIPEQLKKHKIHYKMRRLNNLQKRKLYLI